jgi:hypothetical protein
MRPVETRRIGAHTYHVDPLPTTKGLHVMARVGKALVPALAQGAKLDPAKLKGGASLKVEVLVELASALSAAASSVVDNLSADDLVFVCETFAAHTQVDVDASHRVPLKGIFDVHFAGSYVELGEWIRFCAEVNFGPLLAGLRRAASAPAPAPAAAESK